MAECNAAKTLDNAVLEEFDTDVMTGDRDKRRYVTVQYPHSYEQKSIENCLRQWDFCLQAHAFVRSAQ